MSDAMDVALLRSWIGRTAEATDIVTPRLADEFLATFAPHIGPEEDGPENGGPRNGGAPLGIHWCLSPAIAPATGLGADGHPAKGGFLPPVPLPRRMWAGGELEVRGALRVGDTVVRRSRIEDVAVKSGRSGTLCFVAVRHEYDAGRGVAISERHDIVYRDATPPASSAPPAPGPEPRPAARAPVDLSWVVRADPVLLFRYSAMTFNGHRIHYDLPYVTKTEGYAGLVVHGPIQATLLLHMAARLGQGAPARFSYRGQSPLIAGQDFAVRGTVGPGGAVECWTENEAGAVCMRASAPAAGAA